MLSQIRPCFVGAIRCDPWIIFVRGLLLLQPTPLPPGQMLSLFTVSILKVFDMDSCQRNLSGGYITLLFSVAAGTDAGRGLLSEAGLWKHLASMGSQVR